MTTTQRIILGAVVAIIGLLGVIAGVIYLTTAAKSLPSILGTLPNRGHRSGHGIAALAIGIVLLLGGGGFALYKPRN